MEVWNRWRLENPQIRPNLRKAKLQGKNLRDFNFNDTSFRRVDSNRSDLSQATFRRADLRRADLSDSILVGAELTSRKAELLKTISMEDLMKEFNMTS